MLLLAFFLIPKFDIYPKNKLKQNKLEKKKVDNKFISNSSLCVYPSNESHFLFLFYINVFFLRAVQ